MSKHAVGIDQYDGGTTYDERDRMWHWIGWLCAGAAFWLFVFVAYMEVRA